MAERALLHNGRVEEGSQNLHNEDGTVGRNRITLVESAIEFELEGSPKIGEPRRRDTSQNPG